MSAAQKLLDIPPILAPSPDLPALGPTAVYEKSLEGIHAAAVENLKVIYEAKRACFGCARLKRESYYSCFGRPLQLHQENMEKT